MLPELDSPFVKSFSLENDSSVLEHLWESPKAYLLSQIQKETCGNILVITEGKRKDILYEDLFFFAEKNSLVEIPSLDTFFDHDISPSKDILGKRMKGINKLLSHEKKIILAPLPCLLQKIAKPQDLKAKFKTYEKGDKVSFDPFIQSLYELGYERNSIVSDKGQFSIRGGIIDLYPLTSPLPFRVEFFGDEIEQIRTFDIADQRTVEKVNSFFLCPATEQKDEMDATLIDYLGKDPLIVFDELVELEDEYFSIKENLSQKQMTMPLFLKEIASLKKLYFTKDALDKISSVKVLKKEKTKQEITFDWMDETISCDRHFHPFANAKEFTGQMDLPSFYVGRSSKEAPANAKYIEGSLSYGFALLDARTVVLAQEKEGHVRREVLRQSFHTPTEAFHMLAVGDPVVHTHSGIGKFLGIEKQKGADGQTQDFLTLEFAENSKLFVPLSQSHLISKYIGSSESLPTLSKLGSKKWEKTKVTAQKQILGYAKELLEMQAKRVVHGGYAYPKDSSEYDQFVNLFPYTETHDQLSAIEMVKKDLEKPEAMDRLILGDVGYGKTEVAIRAAFKVAFDGRKQVAVLVPTTVLAMQHFENFTSRMKEFPIRIEALFRGQKKSKQIIEDVKKGDVDILIGTHRLLSKDIKFKDLGLFIIDEEQRFGVRAKEHLKKAKHGIDTLTLSATPIPRTLYMSIIQIKDMSTISTPPFDRLPIKTIVCENEDSVIRNALLREHIRGGQSFFIHNRVETIASRTEHLQKLMPQAKFGYVHGQMNGQAIDDIFCAFKAQEIDILVATTLIENGIDVPNANTILIDDTQRFGLADLYQLRGRVGRWNRPAYAYFLLPPNRQYSSDQKMRLSALVETSGFGGGMKIAMRDLEIRGAGDILGTKQSGQISQVGFHYYCKLLKQTISSLKQNKPFLPPETKMEFSFPAYIPEDYILESSLRMEIYHKLGDAASFEEIEKTLAEIVDRFGKMPEPTLFLYHLMRIKIFCMQNFITHLKFKNISLTAKQTYQKKTVEKSLMLPKKRQTPQNLEEFVIDSLKKQFTCPNS